jgi:EmrB/QacA subfamily drug resistance transporter
MSSIRSSREARPATAPATKQDLATRRRWLAVAVLAVAQFMVFLDETVVNVALPSIKTSLGFSQPSLAWVINAYVLLFGGLILVGGRAADLAGRRRIFLVGTAVFGIASLLDGLATSQGLLIGARALQGIGAALATPAALSLVTNLFPAGAERTKALTMWGALSGLGFAAGVLLGGVITQAASWRWVFFINVPIALASVFVVPRLVTESRNPGRPGFDVAGAVTITAGMSTLVYTLLEGARYGWTSATTMGLFAVAAVLLGIFVVIESRAAVPLVPRGFLHRRATLVPTTLQWLLTVSAFSSFFMLTLYLQQVLRFTPLQAGLSYVPLAAAVIGASAIASKLIPRFGPRPLVVSGLATVGAGLVLLGHVPAGGTYTANILPGLVLIGFGAGFSFVSITTAALAQVQEDAAGLASGLLSSAAQLGGAVGLAVIVAAATTRSTTLLSTGSTAVAAQAGGLRLGFLLAAGAALAASLVAAITLQRQKTHHTTTPETSPSRSRPRRPDALPPPGALQPASPRSIPNRGHENNQKGQPNAER